MPRSLYVLFVFTVNLYNEVGTATKYLWRHYCLAKHTVREKVKEKNLFQNGDEDLLVHWKTIEIAKRGSLIVGCRNYFFCFAVDLTDSGSGCVFYMDYL